MRACRRLAAGSFEFGVEVAQFRAAERLANLFEEFRLLLLDAVLFERLEHHRFVTRREPVTRGGVKTFSSIPVWRHSSSMILEAVRSRVV